jgi:glycerol-3-phosphate dehydrogenase
MADTEPRQHGVKGVYMGGDWLPIEDCAKRLETINGAENCSKNCEACPRSRSRNNAMKSDGTYDVVVIGAGCIGGAIARELSKFHASVLVLEAADDVTQGATKGNSGIVHAGFDDKPGSVRAKFCWPGNQMFPQLDKELNFGYQKNGSLVLARGPEEEKVLEELLDRGKQNGVKRLKILNRKEVLAMEPYVNDEVTAALYAPDAGNLIPYEYAIALCENAVDNGVELRIR